jgi:hypothetical protein
MQRARDLVAETNNVTLSIIAFAFVLVMMLVVPQAIPGSRFGVSCSSLANPIAGGNNQSLLAARSQESEALGLEIELKRSNISVNEPLVVNATFVNRGVGSITLFFVPQEAQLRDDGAPGLYFLIQSIPARANFSEPTTVRPPNQVRQTFRPEVLHVLAPKQRCTEQLTFDTIRLNSLGLSPGRYAIRAVYRNPTHGTLQLVPGATATPIFPDQGVYVTQNLQSNDVEFNYGVAPQVEEPQPLGG